MKIILTAGYTFTPAQKRLDFTGVAGFDPRRLLAVVHVASGNLIYATATPGTGGTFSGPVLTLAFDTTALGANDALAVFYEADLFSATGPAHVTLDAQAAGLALETGHLAAIDGKLPALVNGKVPVAIDGGNVVITGPITVANEVEIKNDTGSPVPTADAGLGTDGTSPPTIAGTGVRGWLRAIYDYLRTGTLTVQGAVTVSDGSGPLTVDGTVQVGNFPTTQAISGAVSATQSGAWTVTLGAGSAAIGTVGVSSLPPLPAGNNAIGSVTVSNLPGTQTVAWSGQSVAVSALPALSTGTNTIGAVNQAGSWSVSVSGTANVSAAQSGTWTVALAAGTTVTANIGTTNGLALDASVQAVKTALGSPFQAGGSIGNTAFGISGTLPAFAATPTFNIGALNGAATAARQDTGNASLASIDGKVPALVAGRVPVDGSGVTQPISGTVSVGNFPATQPVSGTVTANLGSLNGAALAAKQPALGTAGTPSSDVLSVQGVAGGTAVPVSGAFYQATQPVSAVNLPLPSGAATSALQTTGNTSLASIDTKFPPKGQTTLANSLPIAPASDAVFVVQEQPYRPIPGTTRSVTAGPTATAAGSLPLAASGVIPVGTATSYRVRNAATSASPITWILTTDATKTPAIPTPAAQDGTGGTLGDKTLDPGGVEIIGLSAAQQTALAAGTLYLSAVTPSGGSGVLSITPGVGG